ncbi:5' exonuclease Apollo [Ananas comosus]|uniref:5' exonuclease Apollo n=1 Tax=Ananas comosus TaxID=4615 RepID=A0A199VMW6_ANACO|nr:5' exonuclease Apollo [Ananas comosus]
MQVVDIITRHPNHDVIIGIDTLGKEDLLLHISQALGTKIWVWPERLQIMHLLGFDDIFTTNSNLTRVRAVPRYSFTFDTLESLNTIHPTIGIMPSGLPWDSKIFNNDDKLHQYAYPVLYSEHSCFSELQEFMKLVQPSIVTGIVSSSFCYINPRHYFSRLNNFNYEKAESLKGNRNKSFLRPTGSNRLKVRKEGKFKIAGLSFHRGRVAIMRKERRGAKIAETDALCTSKLNVKMG